MELPFPFYKYAPYEKSFFGFTICNDNESLLPPTSSINIFVDKSQPVDHKQLSSTSLDHGRTFESFTDINLYHMAFYVNDWLNFDLPLPKILFKKQSHLKGTIVVTF